jgi:uncharacterized protein YjiS (DUF1127 family)
MATLTHDTARLSAFDGLTSGRNGLAERVRAWMGRRREIARVEFELGTYSDRHLADLGLTRGDIPEVARGRFRRG